MRFGSMESDPEAYILDYDYWTDSHRHEVAPDPDLIEMIAAYASSMTACFHWSLLQPMKNHLQPVPRPKG